MAKNKLQLLLKLEREKEETLRVTYLQAEQHLRDNQQKLKGLNDFRVEYMHQLQQKGRQGLTGAGFGHYQAFLKKIDEAIEQQSNVVGTSKRVADQRKRLWLAQEVKAKAVAKLIEKQEMRAIAAAQKAEQKMLDEFVCNQFFQRNRA